jgi:hypothetical protein
VYVDKSDAPAHQLAAIDHHHDFLVRGLASWRKLRQKAERLTPVPNVAACELAKDKWVDEDVALTEGGR